MHVVTGFWVHQVLITALIAGHDDETAVHPCDQQHTFAQVQQGAGAGALTMPAMGGRIR